MINIVSGLLVVAVSVLIAVTGLTMVQRLVPLQLRKEHNDVAGFIYAVLGVIYAVLIALVVIAVWEDFAAARDTVERESSELDDASSSLMRCRSQKDASFRNSLALMPGSS